MVTNTQSLAAHHLSQGRIHFYNQGQTFSVPVSPSNAAQAIELIYKALYLTERHLVAVRLGVKPSDLIPDPRIGRSHLGLELEKNYLKVLNIEQNPVIYEYTKEMELGYQKIMASPMENLEQTIKEIQINFLKAGEHLKNFSDYIQFLEDFLNSQNGGLLKKLTKNQITKGEIIGSYFGHTRRIFGLVGELNAVYANHQVGYIELATGIILNGQGASLVTEKTATGKAQVGDIKISLIVGPHGGKVELDFPVSIKTSKRDDTKTFHAFGGNPLAHFYDDLGFKDVLVDFVNIYLSKQTAFRALLAAMIADFGLAGRGSNRVADRPIFLAKQTPNSLGVYFFFELYEYYAKNAANIAEIPSIAISDYDYKTAPPSQLDKINNRLVGKAKTESSDVSTGRKFFRAVDKEKMERYSDYMNYLEVKNRVTLKASLTAVWPKFKDTRVSSMSEVVREMDFYRNRKT
jgi:hypothetical protein